MSAPQTMAERIAALSANTIAAATNTAITAALAAKKPEPDESPPTEHKPPNEEPPPDLLRSLSSGDFRGQLASLRVACGNSEPHASLVTRAGLIVRLFLEVDHGKQDGRWKHFSTHHDPSLYLAKRDALLSAVREGLTSAGHPDILADTPGHEMLAMQPRLGSFEVCCTFYYFLQRLLLFYLHVPSSACHRLYLHTSLLCVHHTGLVQPLSRRWRALTAARPPPLQAQHLPLPIAKQRRQEALEAPWHPTARRHYNQPSSAAIAERNNAAARAPRLRRAAPLSASRLLARLNFQRE